MIARKPRKRKLKPYHLFRLPAPPLQSCSDALVQIKEELPELQRILVRRREKDQEVDELLLLDLASLGEASGQVISGLQVGFAEESDSQEQRALLTQLRRDGLGELRTHDGFDTHGGTLLISHLIDRAAS